VGVGIALGDILEILGKMSLGESLELAGARDGISKKRGRHE